MLYVSDTENQVIRRISPAGFVAKIAGQYGVAGSDPGHFYSPRGIAVNNAGEIFVADWYNSTIRKIVGTSVTTLAGSPLLYGSADGTGAAARFALPTGLAFDRSGNLLVGDTANNTIRKVSTTGVVTTWAGRASASGAEDGTGAQARFDWPQGLAIDAEGSIYVAGFPGVRKVTSAGVVSSYWLESGGAYTSGVAVDSAGNMFVADRNTCVIRRTTPGHVTTIIAGQPWDCRHVNGHGTNARFAHPSNITLDAQGNIFVADEYTIRKITPSYDVTRYAGSPTQEPARDGTVNTARFAGPRGLVFDHAGSLFVADGSAIRKITPAGVVTTWAGSLTDNSGLVDGPGDEARFMSTTGLTIDPSGNLYAADWGNHAIRKITPTRVVTTVLGTHAMATVVLGSNPLVNAPWGVVMIDPTHLAISAENAILVLTLP
ncbi:MAG TPA: hypothetical protein VGQ91_16890 [Ideonella sp.]|nr:hypothetical protein [Ideonella sp.]